MSSKSKTKTKSTKSSGNPKYQIQTRAAAAAAAAAASNRNNNSNMSDSNNNDNLTDRTNKRTNKSNNKNNKNHKLSIIDVLPFARMKKIGKNTIIEKKDYILFTIMGCNIRNCKRCRIGHSKFRTQKDLNKLKKDDWYSEINVNTLELQIPIVGTCKVKSNGSYESDSKKEPRLNIPVRGDGQFPLFVGEYKHGLTRLVGRVHNGFLYLRNLDTNIKLLNGNGFEPKEHTPKTLKTIVDLLTNPDFDKYFEWDEPISISNNIFVKNTISNNKIVPYDNPLGNIGMWMNYENLSSTIRSHKDKKSKNYNNENYKLEDITLGWYCIWHFLATS